MGSRNEVSRRLLVAKLMFEIGSGALNERLEEVAFQGGTSVGMPESLKDFVRFPPVGPVVEIDAVEIVLGGRP